MGRTERQELIKTIEEVRGSRLLVYITGDRRGLETRIAMDAFPFVFTHLSRMGYQEKIDLYLYSPGGATMAGYGLVNLIREFCRSFSVIVPFKALSCATLIAFGGDEVIMSKMGLLSPIDPSVTSPYGPRVPRPDIPGVEVLVPVNVEDAMSYLDLAKKEAGLKDEESLAKVFDKLSTNVPPLTLGAVNRAREQIRFLAKTLLSYHMKDEQKIEKIVSVITRERFSHEYMIGRREAKEIVELNVLDVPESLEEKIVSLFNEYNSLFNMNIPYNPEEVLSSQDRAVGQFDRGIIESDNLTHIFRTKKDIRRVEVTQPGVPVPGIGYQERILSESWVEDNSI
nr:serine protease [Candidatus Njordarchaeota archaeon]